MVESHHPDHARLRGRGEKGEREDSYYPDRTRLCEGGRESVLSTHTRAGFLRERQPELPAAAGRNVSPCRSLGESGTPLLPSLSPLHLPFLPLSSPPFHSSPPLPAPHLFRLSLTPSCHNLPSSHTLLFLTACYYPHC